MKHISAYAYFIKNTCNQSVSSSLSKHWTRITPITSRHLPYKYTEKMYNDALYSLQYWYTSHIFPDTVYCWLLKAVDLVPWHCSREVNFVYLPLFPSFAWLRCPGITSRAGLSLAALILSHLRLSLTCAYHVSLAPQFLSHLRLVDWCGFTHVHTCSVTRVQSATDWTASVHTLHMSTPVM